VKLVRRLLIDLRIRYLLWRLRHRRYKGTIPVASITGAAIGGAQGAIAGELVGRRKNKMRG
jgi:hypothetical protein